MVNTGNPPIPGASDNNTPASSKINSQNSRTIVLCFDGTDNQFCEKNSNVIKLFSILRKDEPKSQVCYYQAGIGTYIKPGVVSPIFLPIAKLLDKGFAWYLSEHIIEGYKFLMQNYHKDDKIFIFGFSRGAYTARALAGMLHKVGLLSKDNDEQISFAYNLYKSNDTKSDKLAERFKNTFARDVVIDFLGVWDTVASVGYLHSPTLPFVGSNDMIRVFRHAVSLDEHRAMFRPNLYHAPPDHPDPDPGSANVEAQQTPSVLKRERRGLKWVWECLKWVWECLKWVWRCLKWVWRGLKWVFNALNPFGVKIFKPRLDTRRTSQTVCSQVAQFETDHLEVWFPGCHSDVGGGNTEDINDSTDKTNPALSNISLRWMVRQVAAIRAKCGKSLVDFDEATLKQWNIPCEDIQVQPLVTEGLSVEHYFCDDDAKADITDELKISRAWYGVEILPTYYEWQDDSERRDQWFKQTCCHLAEGRKPPRGAKFHRSVRWRLDNLPFTPQKKFTNANLDLSRIRDDANIVN